MVRVFRIMGRIFGLFGLVGLLIALGFAINTWLFISGAAVADGTVISPINPIAGRRYISTIEFQAGGRTVQFTTGVSSSPPEFTAGQQVRVYYKTDDPAGSARPDSLLSLWFLPLLFGLLSLVFGGLGLAFLGVVWTKERKIAWLRRHGQPLEAEVTNVQMNRSIRNMGRSPYVVLARWHDPKLDRDIYFRSDSEWIEPQNFPPGTWVTVLVDPADYRRYYVQLDPARQTAR